jgi:hypothetical protein
VPLTAVVAEKRPLVTEIAAMFAGDEHLIVCVPL